MTDFVKSIVLTRKNVRHGAGLEPADLERTIFATARVRVPSLGHVVGLVEVLETVES